MGSFLFSGIASSLLSGVLADRWSLRRGGEVAFLSWVRASLWRNTLVNFHVCRFIQGTDNGDTNDGSGYGYRYES